jgi:hypothetical protein
MMKIIKCYENKYYDNYEICERIENVEWWFTSYR